jgi:hypothetical protein
VPVLAVAATAAMVLNRQPFLLTSTEQNQFTAPGRVTSVVSTAPQGQNYAKEYSDGSF